MYSFPKCIEFKFLNFSDNEDDANSVISTGSRNGNNPLENDLGEETETAPEAEGEDDSITRCICDLTHDDGYMICCDKCSAWQHVDCMGIDRQNIPEEYKCELCQPRSIDKQRARHIQLQKRKEQQNIILMNSQQVLPGEPSTSAIIAQPNAPHKTNLPTGKKYKALKKKELAMSLAQQKREKKLAARANGKRREPKKATKRKSKINSDVAVEKAASLRVWIENYEQAITNHYSPELRARLHAIGKHNNQMKEIMPLNVKVLNNLEPKCTTVPHAGGKILISTLDLQSSVPIIEIRGKYMLSSQFKQQLASSSTNNSSRNHQQNKKPGPFIFFYRLPNDGPEVCIDTRTYGNEARFVRRSCRPNAEVIHSIEKGAIHLYIVSLSNIIGGSEITIKHEPDDLAAVARGIIMQPSSSICACGCPKDCIFSAALSAQPVNTQTPPSKINKKINGHIGLDGVIVPYKRSKSLNTRGRSTSSSGDSNAGMLSPNLSSSSIPHLALPVIQNICAVSSAPTPTLNAMTEQNPFAQLQLGPQPPPLIVTPQIIHAECPSLVPQSTQPIQISPHLTPQISSQLSNQILTNQLSNQVPAKLSTQMSLQIPTQISPQLTQIPISSLPPPLLPTSTIIYQEKFQHAIQSPPPLPSPQHSAPVTPPSPVFKLASPPPPPPPQILTINTPIISADVVDSPPTIFQNKQQQSASTTPVTSPVTVTTQRTLSPTKNNQSKKTPMKARNISFSEEPNKTTPSIAIVTSPTSNSENSQTPVTAITTPTATEDNITPQCPINAEIRNQTKPPKSSAKDKDKDSPKLSREERKMQAIMKAFEKMEKNQERKQQLKQNKSSSMTKRRNSSPASPKHKQKDDDEKSYHPRKKKRKGSKSYHQSNHKKTRRRSRMNSGDSDLLTSEESTSLLSPPLPPLNTNPYNTDNQFNDHNMKSPPIPAPPMYMQENTNTSSAAGLLLALSHESFDSSSLSNISSFQIPQRMNNDESTIITSSAPLVSSACLLVEAAVAPLEQHSSETEYKFKTKTKKSIMNEWLNQSEINCHQHETQSRQDINYNSPVKNHDSSIEAVDSIYNYNNTQVMQQCNTSSNYGAEQDEPENLCMAARKMHELIKNNSIVKTEEDDTKWVTPVPNTQYHHNTSTADATVVPFTTPPSGGSGSAAKKRWLRQAISEECSDEITSIPNGFTTPLKKRRVARQVSALTPEEITHSNMYNSVNSYNEMLQFRESPTASPIEESKEIIHIKTDMKHEIKEEIKESNEQEDEIDIVSSPSPGNQIILEDNLVKIEPEDEEKDEKIDVENVISCNSIIPIKEIPIENVKEDIINKEEVMDTSDSSFSLSNVTNSDCSGTFDVDIKPEKTYIEQCNELIAQTKEDIEICVDDENKKIVQNQSEIYENSLPYYAEYIQNESSLKDIAQNNTIYSKMNREMLQNESVFAEITPPDNFIRDDSTVTATTMFVDSNEDTTKNETCESSHILNESGETTPPVIIKSDSITEEMVVDSKFFDGCSSENEIKIEENDNELIHKSEDTDNRDLIQSNNAMDITEVEIKEEKLSSTEIVVETKVDDICKTEVILDVKSGVIADSLVQPNLESSIDTKNTKLLDDSIKSEDTSKTTLQTSVNDEIADIQKRLHSFHTENILILKSRNKKKTLNLQSSKKLNIDKLDDQKTPIIDHNECLSKLSIAKCPNIDNIGEDLKKENLEIIKPKIEDRKENTPDKDDVRHNDNKIASNVPISAASHAVVSKEERHTRWDKPADDATRFENIAQQPIVYSYLNSNTNSMYGISSAVSSTGSIIGSSSIGVTQIAGAPPPPPTIHIPPNTPASHMQYFNAFYNNYPTAAVPTPPVNDESIKRYSLLSSTPSLELNSSTSLPNKSYSTLLDSQQPASQYYCSSTTSLMSSFLNKSYNSDSLNTASSSNITSSVAPPKVLTRTQSADPRLNPNLNIPEPPPVPKRKVRIT